MKPKRSSLLAAVCAGAAGVLLVSAAPAQNLDEVLSAGERRIQLARDSQQQVDEIVNQTRSMTDQYRQVLREVEGLEVYNTILERQIERQEREKSGIREDIDQVTVIQRQIIPLMTRMIDGLEQFVEMDVPFLPGERRERVETLQQLVERQDVSVAEKFRRVMEAYQIENEYGRTIEYYRGELEVGGASRDVDFLRIGRVAFMYQTRDGERQGVWDQQNGEWVELGREYRNRVRLGLRVARQQVAPELLMLPISAPEDI